MKLSIIIPYYNTLEYTGELLDTLAPQIKKSVEVILIDDGSEVPFKTGYEWVKVIRTKRTNPATARNKGLEVAKGDYIQFDYGNVSVRNLIFIYAVGSES